jgi:hypothetical protein
MTPQQVLELAQKQLSAMERAKNAVVKVGLPEGSSATSKVYAGENGKPGISVLQNAINHEYGTQFIVMRSFLRAPFITKQADIKKVIDTQFALVLEKGLDVEIALGRVGVAATNISKGAFNTAGYGEWEDIKEATKKAKGSSGILRDKLILRNSITWVVE